MKQTSLVFEIAGKQITFETGKLALQATSSILARMGDTVVLVTVVQGRLREDIDYFPLSVEIQERLYAGGRIKGSRWVKREGRPSDEAILIGRLIDRSIRPLFPKEYKNEVQVIVTVLSVDGENEPDILALNAVSAAIAISPIPWNGPIGAVRMGLIKDKEGNTEYIVNPLTSEMHHSDLDVVASQLNDKTVMLEAGAKQVPEDEMHTAIVKSHVETQNIIKNIQKLTKEVGVKKAEVKPNTELEQVVALLEKSYKKEIADIILARVDKESGGGGEETEALLLAIHEEIKTVDTQTPIDKKTISKGIEYVMFKQIKHDAVAGKRVDGRKMDEVREITVVVDLLPRTHGSALFQRGLTQALTIATLGSPRMEQLIESADGEEAKRYIHHYSGLPYSYGDTGRVGTPGRREIGHGALAERALEPVIPPKDKFPYTIRLVSEVLSQNGSSSMASTCGSTMALMDAGVPILKPVAGISIGRMSEGEKSVLLTDIIGLEDFSGDMDFKVAGTDSGITAIQLDVKVPGLTDDEIAEILSRAKTARMTILEKMLAVLPKPKTHLSQFAPKIEMLSIPVEKIGELIGPGGRTIKNIIAITGATVDVEDDGSVSITATSDESLTQAVEWVKSLTREVHPGEVFDGEVKRILPFGAFVEILPGKEGMVHVSKMGKGFVKDPSDVVAIGDKVQVRVVEIDDQGRINLSMVIDPKDEGKDREGGGQGPSQGSDRPREDRGGRDNRMGPPEEHPLSRQLKREQFGSRENSRGGRPPRKVRY